MRKLPDRLPRDPERGGLLEPAPERAGTSGPELRPDAVEAPVLELRPDAVALPAPTPKTPAVVQPLAPGRYKVQFTASAELHDKLDRLRALMRSKVPDGDLAAIIEEAVTEKLERLEARRFAKTTTPRKSLADTNISSSSRYIPAAVRRAVSQRDGGRCRYVDSQGRRCPERAELEYHHRFPYALGVDHNPKNICLMCPTHNAYLAERDYGKEVMARHRGSRKRPQDTSARYPGS
jgi:5-methylcytosine-specific restriction endonuclease McrA